MENFESFEEEKKHLEKLPKEVRWLHQIKEEKILGLDEPSVLFASDIMSKIKAKEEKPVFHKGISILFGIIWGGILGLAVWKSSENISISNWTIPSLDFSKFNSIFSFKISSSMMMFSYLLLVFWGLFLLNKFLQKKNFKQNTNISGTPKN